MMLIHPSGRWLILIVWIVPVSVPALGRSPNAVLPLEFAAVPKPCWRHHKLATPWCSRPFPQACRGAIGR